MTDDSELRLSRRALVSGLAASAVATQLVPAEALAAADTRPCHPPHYLKWIGRRERRWSDDIGPAGFVNYYGEPFHYDARIVVDKQSLPSCGLWGATASSMEGPGRVKRNLQKARLNGKPSSTDCHVWPSENDLHFERRIAETYDALATACPDPRGLNQPIRFCAVGSRHSSSDVYKRVKGGRAVVLHIEGINQVLPGRTEFDPAFIRRHAEADDPRYFAMVGAGITICALNETLWTQGLAIETQGSFDGQTLAGAISTGTHGAGVAEGAVADSVEAVVVITCLDTPEGPRWEVVQIEPDPADAITEPDLFRTERAGVPWRLVQDSRLFESAIVAMGTMGIIVAYVMRVKPAYFLYERRVGRPWTEVRGNLFERMRHPPNDFTAEGWRYELVVNSNPFDNVHDWATTEVYRNAWTYDLNYQEEVREIPQKWAGGLARNVNLGGNLGNTITRLANRSLVKGRRVGEFADRCYRVLKLGQGEFVQAWGTEFMVPADRGAELVDWILKTNLEVGDLKRFLPRKTRLVNPFGVRFATGRRGFLSMVRWKRNGELLPVCTAELTEAVKNNRARNLEPGDKPCAKEVVGAWADRFTAEFGDNGRVHWGQVQGNTGRRELDQAYDPDEIEAWYQSFRVLNAYGLFDTTFARRMQFAQQRDADRGKPVPTYRGLGAPLVEAPIRVRDMPDGPVPREQ